MFWTHSLRVGRLSVSKAEGEVLSARSSEAHRVSRGGHARGHAPAKSGWLVALLLGVLLGGAPLGCGEKEAESLSIDQIKSLQAAGRWQRSVDALRVKIDEGERSPETLLLYGTGLSRVGLHSQALWPLREAAKDPELFTRATLQLASGNYVTGNHDLAIEQLSALLEKDPEHLPALKMRCFSRLHTRRDYEGALEDAERAIDLEPESKEMLAPRIVALLGLKDIETAREAIEEFAEQEIVPEDEDSETPVGIRALACVGRAKFYQEDKKIDEAAAQFGECAEAFPSQTIVVHEAMEFFQERGDYVKFDEILRAAYEAAPEDRSFRIALARRQQLLGNTEEARKILEDATDAGYQSAMLDLAGFLVDAGEVDDAIGVYEKAQSLGATGPQFILSFGELLISAGRFDEALELADGPGPESHKAFIRGRASLAKGEYDQALEELTRGVQLWPDNAVARYFAALAAEKAGDVDRAIEEYRNAMRIDAAAADSRLRLARLHLEEGNPKASIYVLRYQTQDLEKLRENMLLIQLELEAIGAAGELEQIPPGLITQVSFPAVWGQAVAALARGVERREGAKGAVAMIEVADRLDLTSVSAAAALREYVRYLDELGRSDEAIEHARKAARAHPKSLLNQVVLGEALLRAEDLDGAGDAFGRALADAPESAPALAGAARVAAARGQFEKAFGLFESAEKAVFDPDTALFHAEALAAAGRSQDAAVVLAEALDEEPSSGKLALALAKLKLGLDPADAEGQKVAERALRLGGGDEAKKLLPGAGAEADPSA